MRAQTFLGDNKYFFTNKIFIKDRKISSQIWFINYLDRARKKTPEHNYWCINIYVTNGCCDNDRIEITIIIEAIICDVNIHAPINTFWFLLILFLLLKFQITREEYIFRLSLSISIYLNYHYLFAREYISVHRYLLWCISGPAFCSPLYDTYAFHIRS